MSYIQETGGEVQYKIVNWDNQTLNENDGVNVTIEPSFFTALPNRTYISKVKSRTNSNLKESTAFRIKTRVNNQDCYCDDVISLYTMIVPGMSTMSIDREIIDNATVLKVKQNNTAMLSLSFMKGNAGIREIFYEVSPTPLNVTVSPSSFIAKRGTGNYPATMTVSADKTLPPDTYHFFINVKGGTYLDPSRFLFTVEGSVSILL